MSKIIAAYFILQHTRFRVPRMQGANADGPPDRCCWSGGPSGPAVREGWLSASAELQPLDEVGGVVRGHHGHFQRGDLAFADFAECRLQLGLGPHPPAV